MDCLGLFVMSMMTIMIVMVIMIMTIYDCDGDDNHDDCHLDWVSRVLDNPLLLLDLLPGKQLLEVGGRREAQGPVHDHDDDDGDDDHDDDGE